MLRRTSRSRNETVTGRADGRSSVRGRATSTNDDARRPRRWFDWCRTICTACRRSTTSASRASMTRGARSWRRSPTRSSRAVCSTTASRASAATPVPTSLCSRSPARVATSARAATRLTRQLTSAPAPARHRGVRRAYRRQGAGARPSVCGAAHPVRSRNPVALERQTYDQAAKVVTSRSDKSEGPTAGTGIVYRLEFLARVLVPIPDQGHLTTRYDGWYANRLPTLGRYACRDRDNLPFEEAPAAALLPFRAFLNEELRPTAHHYRSLVCYGFLQLIGSCAGASASSRQHRTVDHRTGRHAGDTPEIRRKLGFRRLSGAAGSRRQIRSRTVRLVEALRRAGHA